jgi:4-amino-4-deoxy-L-arabinose transferase-like glycosyltransferase
MKAKFIIPLIAVVLCLAFLLENLKVQRVLFGLALILIASLLWRAAVRGRSGPVRPGSAQPDSPANGSQPIRSETNPTPPEAGSRR